MAGRPGGGSCQHFFGDEIETALIGRRPVEAGRFAAATLGATMAYLDHAATTPMLPEAVRAMTAAFGEHGNPSSLHASGRRARRAIEEAREQLAAALGARP